MKSALVPGLLLLTALACKPHTETPEPALYRYEPVSSVFKDIEQTQIPLTISYQDVIDERTNQRVKLASVDVLPDLTAIREPIEAFKNAHPDYALYFRVEIRPYKPDSVLADGSRKIRAGCLCEVDVRYGDNNVGGPMMTAKDPNASWDFVSTEVQKTLKQVLVPRLQRGQPFKVLLAVYDFNRFTADPTAFGGFDGSVIKSWENGGSRVLYRGWNVEIK